MNTFYINGRFLTQPLSGMQRYAGEMVSALDRLLATGEVVPSINRVEVLVPNSQYHRYNWNQIHVRQVGSLHGHLWEQIDLALSARNGILLNLTSSGPIAHGNSVLVMHDAAIFAHPEHFSLGYRTFHSFMRPKLARKAKALVTISEFSRHELSFWCGVPESRFTIIGDSAEHIAHVEPVPGILELHGLRKGAYALTVGNQSPNKNISMTIRAFERAAPKDWLLAVAGGGSEKVFGNTEKSDRTSVKRLGRVSDGELRALYENAGLFLFPSRYEGFGVPPLEAMTLGCPVLTSDASAMPEVLGDAAMYFKSDDVDDFALQIARLCSDVDLRERYRRAGRQRTLAYSWDASGQAMFALMQTLR